MRERIRNFLYGLALWFDATFPRPARVPDEHEDVANVGRMD